MCVRQQATWPWSTSFPFRGFSWGFPLQGHGFAFLACIRSLPCLACFSQPVAGQPPPHCLLDITAVDGWPWTLPLLNLQILSLSILKHKISIKTASSAFCAMECKGGIPSLEYLAYSLSWLEVPAVTQIWFLTVKFSGRKSALGRKMIRNHKFCC